MTEKEQLQKALADKARAESEIKEILGRYPNKNKTMVTYKILGLCPQCGAEKPEVGYYCEKCRAWLSDLANQRNDRLKSQALPAYEQPANSPYNNDNH